MIVVFDTNVVVEAIFWQRSSARRALTGLALRRFKTAVSREILEEYETVVAEVRRRLFPQALSSGVTPQIGLYADDAGKPGSTLVGAFANPASNDGSAADFIFTSAGIGLSPGLTYWLVTQASSGGFMMGTSTTPPSGIGATFGSTGYLPLYLDSPEWAVYSGQYQMIEVAGTPVPEPATWALFASFSLAGFAVLRRVRSF